MAASSGAQSSSGAPLTLAQQYEQEEDSPISFELAVKVTGALVCATTKKPDHHDGPRRAIQPVHLPLMDELTSRAKPGTLPVTHLVDQSAGILRSGIEASPSWEKEKASLAKKSGTWLDRDLLMLLDGNGQSRYALRLDERHYHRISAQYLCTDAFLVNFLATLLHPATKGARERVLSSLGEKSDYTRYLLPECHRIFHTLAEGVLAHPL
ncbi:unnamed protein product, partial [Prorocentrum cordatum]